MDNLPDIAPGAPIPDALTPPSRPGWKVFLGVAVAVIGVAAIMHGQAVAQFLGLASK